MTPFSGQVPLFPLPNVILFPKMLLPLHLFEPRYRELIKDVLAGERLIGMALLKPGWEKDYDGNPEVHEVVGIGRVVQDEKLPDGRYNILLQGEERARVLDVVRWKPYRTVRVEILEDELPEPSSDRPEEVRQLLLGHARASFNLELADEVPIGVLADALAATLNVNIHEKQRVLEECNVLRRAEQVLAFVQMTQKPKPGFPPEPSMN